jgi:hypothetical protein
VSSLIESTVTWIRRALKGRGADLPGEIDVARLYSSPDYSGEFLELVLKLLDGEDAAIHLPLALEVIQFSVEEGDKRLPKLENAVTKAETLVATLKGFVMRNLGVQGDLLEPVGVDLGKQFGIQKGV